MDGVLLYTVFDSVMNFWLCIAKSVSNIISRIFPSNRRIKRKEEEKPNDPESDEKIKMYIDLLGNSINEPLLTREDALKTYPEWNIQKIKRGQELAMDYYSSLCFSEFISIFLLLTDPNGLSVLTFTDKSNTVETAALRYMSTAKRVLSWYRDDLFDPKTEGYKNLKTVASMHHKVNKDIGTITESVLKRLNELDISDETREIAKALVDDNANSNHSNQLVLIANKGYLPFSQGNMTVTLMAFMGLIILYPEQFGLRGVDEEDLDSFVYLWRYIGAHLGIKNDLNLCTGEFHEVKLRCKILVDHFFKYTLSHVSEAWTHMAHCSASGIALYLKQTSFLSAIVFLYQLLGLNCQTVYDKLSVNDQIKLMFYYFTFNQLVPIKFIRKNINAGTQKLLEKTKIK